MEIVLGVEHSSKRALNFCELHAKGISSIKTAKPPALTAKFTNSFIVHLRSSISLKFSFPFLLLPSNL